MYYYILPTDMDIQHHGVLGMKWGVRRYQSYDTAPRKSGERGKELIKNVKSTNKQLKLRTKSNKAKYKYLKQQYKAYKKSIKIGNADGGADLKSDRAKKLKADYQKKLQKGKSATGVYNESIGSEKLVHKYRIGVAKVNNMQKKYNKVKLDYNKRYDNAEVRRVWSEYIEF